MWFFPSDLGTFKNAAAGSHYVSILFSNVECESCAASEEYCSDGGYASNMETQGANNVFVSEPVWSLNLLLQ